MDTGKIHFNAQKGDDRSSAPIAMSLSRKKGNKDQRIILLGDADLFE